MTSDRTGTHQLIRACDTPAPFGDHDVPPTSSTYSAAPGCLSQFYSGSCYDETEQMKGGKEVRGFIISLKTVETVQGPCGGIGYRMGPVYPIHSTSRDKYQNFFNLTSQHMTNITDFG